MKKTLVATLCSICFVSSYADTPKEIKFCYDEEEAYPWTLKEREDLSIKLISMALRSIDLTLKATPIPWKRCLSEMKNGNFDGAIGASFKTERLEFGNYPMGADSKADPEMRMYIGGYTLYRLKGSKLNWDGNMISGLEGKIGVQPGYSVADQLKTLGAAYDDGTRASTDQFNKLIAGRVGGIALQSTEGDNLLKNNPDFAAKVEAISPPLSAKPYYFMLSKQLEANSPGLSKKIWEAAAKTRDSAEYKTVVESFK